MRDHETRARSVAVRPAPSTAVLTFTLTLTLAVLAACASPGTWQNPNVPEDEWGKDKAECQAIAQRNAEREFVLSQQSGRSLNYDRGGMWATQMDQFSAQQSQQDFFASCMKQRGYKLVSPDGQEQN